VSIYVPFWVVFGLAGIAGIAIVAYVAIRLYDRWMLARLQRWWWHR